MWAFLFNILLVVITLLVGTLISFIPETAEPDAPIVYRLQGGSEEGVPAYFVLGNDESHSLSWRPQGTLVEGIGRSTADAESWLMVEPKEKQEQSRFPAEFWVSETNAELVEGDPDELPFILAAGLWNIEPQAAEEPGLVTADAHWNSWQWDPAGGGLWYAHSESSPAGRRERGPLTRFVPQDDGDRREHVTVSGDVLAAPTTGAVLVRARDWDTWPIGQVYIVEADGTTHQIGSQCWVVFSDAYHPFGTHAAWSPDGRYVVLRNSPSQPDPDRPAACFIEGTTIYDRNGPITPDLTDPNDPYRQDWYRKPNFTDQVGTDETCTDAPPGVTLSDRRNRCQWSPDRQWFATMPGSEDNPHLGELLIYTADGALTKRFLIVGWPCNTFQWSPDSDRLAYGGPSACA